MGWNSNYGPLLLSTLLTIYWELHWVSAAGHCFSLTWPDRQYPMLCVGTQNITQRIWREKGAILGIEILFKGFIEKEESLFTKAPDGDIWLWFTPESSGNWWCASNVKTTTTTILHCGWCWGEWDIQWHSMTKCLACLAAAHQHPLPGWQLQVHHTLSTLQEQWFSTQVHMTFKLKHASSPFFY